ncbi:MAG: leucyl aminopeptidase family protein [Salinivirgaceae bacterium]|jgi:leucyl aminopeptidase|nr:leucyl aminopeptidase family protein [Salinivirgaceae bacterium]
MNNIIFNLVKDTPQLVNTVFIVDRFDKLDKNIFSDREIDYIQHRIAQNARLIPLNYFYHWNFIVLSGTDESCGDELEAIRRTGAELAEKVKTNELDFLTIVDHTQKKETTAALVEGLVLASYSFNKFKKNDNSGKLFKRINIFNKDFTTADIDELEIMVQTVSFARDLVNEPASSLTATKFADELTRMAHMSGLSVELYRKEELKKMNMGGILSVNQGSEEPPVLIKLEWKHPKSKNKKPYAFVGKGVMYDSGGLSLKPTTKSMDYMKSDMAGGAAAAGLMFSIARNKLPIHAIALIPATDNRINSKAFAPGDVVTMHNGKTVEVMNTDAEGRMILADALSLIDKHEPEFVLSIATLTGSASRAVGPYGIVAMGNAKQKYFDQLEESGEKTYERIVQFPFWDDYATMLKSDIADLKNIGGESAGAITAGKFLENFTSHPFIHLDIAGVAYTHTPRDYYKFGATGVGIRLLYDFVKSLTK